MGVDYRAVIIVGYPHEDISDKIEELMIEDEGDDIDAYEWLEDKGIEWVGPYYDCPIEESLVGIIVKQTHSYQWTEFSIGSSEIVMIVNSADKLSKIFDKAPKVYLTPQGW